MVLQSALRRQNKESRRVVRTLKKLEQRGELPKGIKICIKSVG
jgi:hypothetical protein